MARAVAAAMPVAKAVGRDLLGEAAAARARGECIAGAMAAAYWARRAARAALN